LYVQISPKKLAPKLSLEKDCIDPSFNASTRAPPEMVMLSLTLLLVVMMHPNINLSSTMNFFDFRTYENKENMQV
jgi:hypothetical protein